MSGRLLTTLEVAERFGVCTETVLRWVRSGRLPAIRLSRGAIRFREEDIEAFLQEHATVAGNANRGVRHHPQGAAHRELFCPPSPLSDSPTEEDH